jgi:hypothetical protein
MDMFQLNNEINHRRDSLMAEAKQHRLANLAQQADENTSKPSWVQRLAATLGNVSTSSPAPHKSTPRASAKI